NFNTEIGWHLHCYRKHGDRYYQQTDHNEIIKEMWKVYYSTHVVREAKCFRMGGAVMHNDIMATLVKMGFKCDSSALPGCNRDDEHRKFDWSRTGNTPY